MYFTKDVWDQKYIELLSGNSDCIDFKTLKILKLAVFHNPQSKLTLAGDIYNMHVYSHWWRSNQWVVFDFDKNYCHDHWRLQPKTLSPRSQISASISFLISLTQPIVRDGWYDETQWRFLNYVHKEINLFDFLVPV